MISARFTSLATAAALTLATGCMIPGGDDIDDDPEANRTAPRFRSLEAYETKVGVTAVGGVQHIYMDDGVGSWNRPEYEVSIDTPDIQIERGAREGTLRASAPARGTLTVRAPDGTVYAQLAVSAEHATDTPPEIAGRVVALDETTDEGAPIYLSGTSFQVRFPWQGPVDGDARFTAAGNRPGVRRIDHRSADVTLHEEGIAVLMYSVGDHDQRLAFPVVRRADRIALREVPTVWRAGVSNDVCVEALSGDRVVVGATWTISAQGKQVSTYDCASYKPEPGPLTITATGAGVTGTFVFDVVP